jgi:hypothetical protein
MKRAYSILRNSIKSRFRRLIFLIVGFWYLAMWPGRLGYDYSLAIRMIRANQSTDWWTALYFRFLEFSTFYGATIMLTSFIGLITLAFSLWFFLSSVIQDLRVLKITYLAILSTPLFGVFGVTVSHDVLQTAGIISFLGLLIRVRRNLLSNRDFVLSYIFASMCLLTVKTGFITIFVLTVVLYFTRYRMFALRSLIPIVLVAVISQVGIGSSIIKHPGTNVLLSDLKCVAQHPEADISEQEWLTLQEFAPRELWVQPVTCSNMDLQISTLGISESDIQSPNTFFLDYLRIVSKNPLIVIQAHIQKSLGALPPPFFPGPQNQVDQNIDNPVGYGVNTALQKGPELLHPSIDEPSVAVKVKLLLPLQAIAQTLTFLINQASWFWAWGGLWLWPILFFYISSLRLTKFSQIFVSLLPIFLLHAGNVILGPGPLGRYYMSTILVGVSLTISLLLSWIEKVRQHE